MLKKKISFHNMPHSEPLENHAQEKIAKIEELLKKDNVGTPQFLEVWLKANKQHPHHAVEMKLKTPQFDINAHDEGVDLYVVLDNTIDKMVKLLNKSKDKMIDKQHKPENEKRKFIEEDDKYTLG